MGFMSIVADNIRNIREELSDYQGRVIAVSKYVSKEDMLEAYDTGIRDFAESKTQDALAKMNNLPEGMKNDCVWHFIGHLQTNKAKKVVGEFDYIHSVDSLKLVKVVNDLAEEKGLVQKILLQVNIADEDTKFGFSSEELFKVFPEIVSLKNIKIEGLMMMAPYSNDEVYLTALFAKLKKLKEKLECVFGLSIKELSMGMSNDFKIAINYGATKVRLGRIFLL